MPILNNILDHEVLGREYKRGLQQGRQEGVQEGELILLRSLIEKRFGPLPKWADEKLSKLSEKEVKELGLRLFDVAAIEDLLLKQ